MKYKVIGFVTLVIALTACAKHRPSPLPLDPKAAWPVHAQRAGNVKRWLLKGKAGINTKEKAWAADLMWKLAARHHYTLRLTGPMGQGALHLVAMPKRVSINTSDGRRAHALSAHELLLTELGWDLPVDKAYFWIRGLPAPGASKQTLDAAGHLASLEQAGWQIDYQSYTHYPKVDLPLRMRITSPRFKLKLVKLKWEVP